MVVVLLLPLLLFDVFILISAQILLFLNKWFVQIYFNIINIVERVLSIFFPVIHLLVLNNLLFDILFCHTNSMLINR